MQVRRKKPQGLTYSHEKNAQEKSSRIRDTISKWQSGKEAEEEMDYLLGVARGLDLVVNKQGDIFDHNKEKVSPNHLKSILRRCYIEDEKSLRGKALSIFMEKFTDSMTTGVRITMKLKEKDEVPLAELIDDINF